MRKLSAIFRLIFVLALACPTAARSAEPVSRRFEDWTLLCDFTVGHDVANDCALTHHIAQTGVEARWLRLGASFEADGALRMKVRVARTFDAVEGAVVSVDGRQSGLLRLGNCERDFCEGEAKVRQALLQELVTGSDLRLEFPTGERSGESVRVSLSGFRDGVEEMRRRVSQAVAVKEDVQKLRQSPSSGYGSLKFEILLSAAKPEDAFAFGGAEGASLATKQGKPCGNHRKRSDSSTLSLSLLEDGTLRPGDLSRLNNFIAGASECRDTQYFVIRPIEKQSVVGYAGASPLPLVPSGPTGEVFGQLALRRYFNVKGIGDDRLVLGVAPSEFRVYRPTN